MCAASNGIGPGISKVIKITVNGECNLLILASLQIAINIHTTRSLSIFGGLI